jgi:hypothetical protein
VPIPWLDGGNDDGTWIGMSVLDDIQSNAEAAHGSFDEAKTLVSGRRTRRAN